MTEKTHKPTEKAKQLLASHQLDIIEELGTTAFDLLTPAEAAKEIDVPTSRLPDLIRQGWLAYVPGKDIGSAHQYYRWRAEFVKRYRGQYSRKSEPRKYKTVLSW